MKVKVKVDVDLDSDVEGPKSGVGDKKGKEEKKRSINSMWRQKLEVLRSSRTLE